MKILPIKRFNVHIIHPFLLATLVDSDLFVFAGDVIRAPLVMINDKNNRHEQTQEVH